MDAKRYVKRKMLCWAFRKAKKAVTRGEPIRVDPAERRWVERRFMAEAAAMELLEAAEKVVTDILNVVEKVVKR